MKLWQQEKGSPLDRRFFDVFHRVYGETYQEEEQSIRTQLSIRNPYVQAIELRIFGVDTQSRLVASYDSRLQIDGQSVVFFGFWESQPDKRASAKIFEGLFSWARERGVTRIYGPINLTTYGKYRIRIEGFDTRIPFPAEPYNPPYYAELLKEAGFRCVQRYMSLFGNEYHLPAFANVAPKIQKDLDQHGFRVVSLTPEFWLSRRAEIYPIFQNIWKDTFGYMPIDYATFCAFFDEKATAPLDPHASVVVLDRHDEIAGYFAIYPDYGPLLAQGVSSSQLSYRKHFSLLHSPGMLMKTGCVLPQYRRFGLFTAMSVLAGARALRYGYSHPIAALVRSDNPSGRMDAYSTRLDARAVSTKHVYGLFMRDL